MKDDGRAAIIIGGHNEYDNTGRLKKDRIFFNWLYNNYNVDAVLNISGNLYKKQGTQFPIRLILVNGRKAKPDGVAPLYNESKDAVVDNSEDLYNKIKEVRDENLLRPRTDAERGHSGIASMQNPRELQSEGTQGSNTLSSKPSGRTDGKERDGGLGFNVTNRGQIGPGESVHRQYERSSRNAIGKPALPEGVQREGTIGRDTEPTRSGDDIQRSYDRGYNTTVTGKALLEENKPNVPYTPKS